MPHKKRTEDLSPFRRQRYFAYNLRFAVNYYGWTLKEAAENLGVTYTWIRRAVTQGVHHTRKTNPAIEKLVAYFKCAPELLWNPDQEFVIHLSKRLGPKRSLPKELDILLAHFAGRPWPEPFRMACKIITIYHGLIRLDREPTEAEFAEASEKINALATSYSNVVELLARAIKDQSKVAAEEISEEEALQVAEVYAGRMMKPDPPDPRPYRLAAELGLELFKATWCEGDRFLGQSLSDCLPSVAQMAEEIAQADNNHMEHVLYVVQALTEQNYCEIVDRKLGRDVQYPKWVKSFRSTEYYEAPPRSAEEEAEERLQELKEDGERWEKPRSD